MITLPSAYLNLHSEKHESGRSVWKTFSNISSYVKDRFDPLSIFSKAYPKNEYLHHLDDRIESGSEHPLARTDELSDLLAGLPRSSENVLIINNDHEKDDIMKKMDAFIGALSMPASERWRMIVVAGHHWKNQNHYNTFEPSLKDMQGVFGSEGTMAEDGKSVHWEDQGVTLIQGGALKDSQDPRHAEVAAQLAELTKDAVHVKFDEATSPALYANLSDDFFKRKLDKDGNPGRNILDKSCNLMLADHELLWGFNAKCGFTRDGKDGPNKDPWTLAEDLCLKHGVIVLENNGSTQMSDVRHGSHIPGSEARLQMPPLSANDLEAHGVQLAMSFNNITCWTARQMATLTKTFGQEFVDEYLVGTVKSALQAVFKTSGFSELPIVTQNWVNNMLNPGDYNPHTNCRSVDSTFDRAEIVPLVINCPHESTTTDYMGQTVNGNDDLCAAQRHVFIGVSISRGEHNEPVIDVPREGKVTHYLTWGADEALRTLRGTKVTQELQKRLKDVNGQKETIVNQDIAMTWKALCQVEDTLLEKLEEVGTAEAFEKSKFDRDTIRGYWDQATKALRNGLMTQVANEVIASGGVQAEGVPGESEE